MKTYQIYCLKCPNTNEIRYIGYTCQILIKRYRCHLDDVKKTRSHKTNWIKSLLINNQKPIIESLENNIQTLEEASRLEVEYIDKYKKLGYNLTNSTSGGETNKVFNEEVRNKISETLKKKYKSGEIINWNTGRHVPNKSKGNPRECQKGERNSFYGKHHTEETKKLLKEKNKIHKHVDIKEVKHLYVEEKLKQKDIAKIYNVSPKYICKILLKEGIRRYKTKKIIHKTMNKENTSWSKEDLDLLRKLAKENVDTTEISRRLGRTEKAIYDKAGELGISLKPKDKNNN